jgi:hypothetical protein
MNLRALTLQSTRPARKSAQAGDFECLFALWSSERACGSGIHLFARRQADKRMEQTLRVNK